MTTPNSGPATEPRAVRPTITRALAAVGAVLVWLPIVAPVALTVVSAVAGHGLRFDFLMPAELFPLALGGSALLLWAALRARMHRRMIAWALGVAVAALAGSQGLAVLTGLASGATEPRGWPLAVVLTVYAVFVLALVALGAGGLVLLRDLARERRARVA